MMTDEEIQREQDLIREQSTWVVDHMSRSEVSDQTAQSVTPLDLLNSKNYTTKKIRDDRYEICNDCDELWKPIKMCKQCGCNMPLKTWLSNASCPLGKWLPEVTMNKEK